MKIGQAYPSNYLSSDDFDQPALATVAQCVMQNIGQGTDIEEKPIVRFREYEKSLILNVTNFKTLAATLGEDSDQWPGGKIVIFAAMTEYKGDSVPCIRLRAPAATTQVGVLQGAAADVNPLDVPAPEPEAAF